MKKKILTFLIALVMLLPCAFLFAGCDQNPPGDPVLLGYEVYISGTKTDEFSCGAGEEAITPDDVTVKSNWTDQSQNAFVPISEFEVSVCWRDQYNSDRTELPDFWTNQTGDTTNSYATTYDFTLTKDGLSVEFSVSIEPVRVTDCRVLIFDGNELSDEAQMVWGHNERESDPNKHFRFELENLDAGYDLQEHIQWAIIEKEDYDALGSPEEQRTFIENSYDFSTSQIDGRILPGTYYVFAYVPECDNIRYGTYGDGKIYDYATLTISKIQFVQVEAENRLLRHNDFQNIDDFKFNSLNMYAEITNVDSSIFSCFPYGFDDNVWGIDDEGYSKVIKVHAVKIDGNYYMVDLKDHTSSLSEWVFVNNDGTKGADVDMGQHQIELVDYSEILAYKNCTFKKTSNPPVTFSPSITFPVYYKVQVNEGYEAIYDCEKVFRTEVTIRKHTTNIVPHIEVNTGGAITSKYVTARDTFEFPFGELVQATWDDVWTPEYVMTQALYRSGGLYDLVNFNQTAYNEEAYVGLARLTSHNYAWKLDGENYTSEALEIEYFINKAEIETPKYNNAVGSTNYFENPIKVAFDASRQSYKLDNYISISNYVKVTGEVNDNSELNLTFEQSWGLSVYALKLSAADAALGVEELAKKVREQGTKVGYEGLFASEADNAAGEVFVIMYDLSNTNSTVWKDGTTTPKLFKIEIE